MVRIALYAWCAVRRGLALSVFVGLAGCGGSGDSGGVVQPPVVDNTPASVVVVPAAAFTLQSGTTATLAATVSAKDGHVVTSAVVTWTSADPTIASVVGGLVTGIKVGATTITAGSGGANASVTVTVTPGAAVKLALRTQPGGAVLGSPLTVQPVVEVQDAAGNLVASATALVTAAIGASDGTLGGTTSVSAVGGVATFANLSVSGTANTKTLIFTSVGLASVTSVPFAITAPPTPLIVVDTAIVAFATTTGSNPAPRIVTITNGGGAPLTAVTADSVVYDAGQPTGWLTATITGTSAPFMLTLTAAAAALPAGVYHAAVRVNASGASNSPVTISITLTVAISSSVTYGASTERIRMLDVGGAYTPAVTAALGGQTQGATSLTFISRATSVATVAPGGRITAVGPGQTWVVATLQGASDSVWVIVTRTPLGPVLRTDLTNYAVRSADTITVNFTLDPRGANVGGATVIVGYETENAMFDVQSTSIPAQSPMPVVGNSTYGAFKINVAAAAGITTPLVMLQFKAVVRTAGLAGFLTFSVVDIVAPDGTDLSAQTTSTRYPVIIR